MWATFFITTNHGKFTIEFCMTFERRFLKVDNQNEINKNETGMTKARILHLITYKLFMYFQEIKIRQITTDNCIYLSF